MGNFLLIGVILGAAVGFLNMLTFMASRLGQPGLNPLKTLWHGLWIWILWTVFGAYVLALWIVGLVLYGIARVLKRGSTA